MNYYLWFVAIITVVGCIILSKRLYNKVTISHIKKQAEQGDADAQLKLGLMYNNGQGVPRDFIAAFEWFAKAAKQGNQEAQQRLGALNSNGKNSYQDSSKASESNSKATDHDNMIITDLMKIITEGRCNKLEYNIKRCEEVIPQDYKKAAEQGDPIAQVTMGLMYHNGDGVPKDDAIAFEWFSKAAEQGETAAQVIMGVMYYNGDGVQKDNDKAFEWLAKAVKVSNEEDKIDLKLSLTKNITHEN